MSGLGRLIALVASWLVLQTASPGLYAQDRRVDENKYVPTTIDPLMRAGIGEGRAQQLILAWQQEGERVVGCMLALIKGQRTTISVLAQQGYGGPVASLIQQGIGPRHPMLVNTTEDCERVLSRPLRQDYECEGRLANGAMAVSRCDEAWVEVEAKEPTKPLSLDEAIAVMAANRKIGVMGFERPEAAAARKEAARLEAEKERAKKEAAKIQALISGQVQGVGLLVASSASNVCKPPGEDEFWKLVQKKYVLEHGATLGGLFFEGDSASIFTSVKAQRCGSVLGTTDLLRPVAQAMLSEGVTFSLNDHWMQEPAVAFFKDQAAELQRKQAEVEEKERLAAQRKEAEAKAREQLAARAREEQRIAEDAARARAEEQRAAEARAKEEAARCLADPICRKKAAELDARKKAEAERIEFEERQRRERLGIVTIQVFCEVFNGASAYLIHCLDKYGSLRIGSKGSITEYSIYALGPREALRVDLEAPWQVIAQNGGSDALKLVVKVTFPDGRVIRREASGSRAIFLP